MTIYIGTMLAWTSITLLMNVDTIFVCSFVYIRADGAEIAYDITMQPSDTV